MFLLVFVVNVYLPGSKTIADGLLPLAPETVTNCGSVVGRNSTFALQKKIDLVIIV